MQYTHEVSKLWSNHRVEMSCLLGKAVLIPQLYQQPNFLYVYLEQKESNDFTINSLTMVAKTPSPTCVDLRRAHKCAFTRETVKVAIAPRFL